MIQKSKAKLGTDLIGFLNGLLQGSFFTQAINITDKQALAEDDLLLLLQGMLLLDNSHDGMDYKNISMATCLGYAEGIRGNYSVQKREKLRGIVQYLDKAFDAKVKFLKKNNVPIVLAMAETAMDSGRDAQSFRAFINDFANGMYPAYEEASGSGNVKASKVQQRLRVMYLAMCSYYRMKPSEEDKPFAREIPLYLEGRAVDDLVGEAEPISETSGSNPVVTEWAEKSFGETGPLSEASDEVLGDIKAGELETELLGEESGLEPELGENVEINQAGLSSDVQNEESTENPDEVSQPASGVDSGGSRRKQAQMSERVIKGYFLRVSDEGMQFKGYMAEFVDTLEYLQEYVDGYIDVLSLNDEIDLVINDEGKIHNSDGNFDSILESDIPLIEKKLIPLMSVDTVEDRIIYTMINVRVLPEYDGEQ